MINLEKAQKVVELLTEKGMTLGSVESLTGGLFSSTVCGIPGASKTFKGGLVTYAASEKVALLGIDPKVIDEFGVVSKEVAKEMATKGQSKLNVDVCVSFTGNAGPTREPGDAPVGRVEMCLVIKEKIISITKDFNLPRNILREACVDTMLEEISENFLNN